MFKPATTPQNPDQVIQNAWRLFLSYWKQVSNLAFLIAFVGILPNLLVPELNSDTPDIVLIGMQQFSDYLLLYIMVNIILHNALILHIYQLMQQQTPATLAQNLWQGLSKMLSVLLASVIFATIVVLGLFAFFVPAVYFAVRLFFYTPLIVIHNQTIFDSLNSSFKLTQDNWWRTLQVLLMPLFIFFAATLLITLFSALLMQLGLDANGSTFTGIALLFQFVTTALITPLLYVFVLLQLNDLQLRAGMQPPSNNTDDPDQDKEFIA